MNVPTTTELIALAVISANASVKAMLQEAESIKAKTRPIVRIVPQNFIVSPFKVKLSPEMIVSDQEPLNPREASIGI